MEESKEKSASGMEHAESSFKSERVGMKRFWFMLIPVFFAFLAAVPSSRFDFVGDDSILILENPDVQSLKRIPTLFTKDFFARPIVGLSAESNIGYYRPFTKTTFALDWSIWGRNPFGFHLTNVFLHMFLAMLIHLLAVNLGFDLKASLAASTLFAVYFPHAQAVALINARSDILCAFGLTLACLGAVRSNLLLPALGTFIAVFSKEPGVFAPVLIVLSLWSIKKPILLNKIIIGSSALIVIIYLTVRILFPGLTAHGIGGVFDGISLKWAVLSGKSLGVNLLALTGFDASHMSLLTVPESFFSISVIFAWLLWIFLCFVCFYAIYSKKVYGFALFWIVFAFLPLLMVQKINVPFSDILIPLHERWTYIPSIGVCLCLGSLLTKAKPSLTIYKALLIAILALSFVYWFKLMPYRNASSMHADWLATLQEVPLQELPKPIKALRLEMEGVLEGERGNLDRAFKLLQAANLLSPNNSRIKANLASLYMKRGDYKNAVKFYRESLKPELVSKNGEIAIYILKDSDARERSLRYANLGEALRLIGNYKKAEKALRTAFKGEPNNAKYVLNLAAILAIQSKWDESKKYYFESIELKPCYKKAIIALEEISKITKDKKLAFEINVVLKECWIKKSLTP